MNQEQERNIEELVATFTRIDEKLSHYQEIISLIDWDLQTSTPKKGKASRSEALGTLSQEMFQIALSPELKTVLNELSSPPIFEQLDLITQAKVRERNKEYNRLTKIPTEFYKEYVILSAKAQDIWEEAKENNDFKLFQPSLEKMVEMKRTFAKLYGYENHPYDALLDEYEPGYTVALLDPLFQELRDKTIDLLHKIQSSPHQPKTSFFHQKFDIEKQKELNILALKTLGYDFQAGRLDESVHPFASGLNMNDVRITTHYIEEDVRSALFSTIHECGHALYEQGMNESFKGTILAGGTSMGIHESQSRFLENMIGRSFSFWRYFYKFVQELFPTQFNGVTNEEFCQAINIVEPSLIRIEADELTYNLHIIVRYEIEKGLIDGSIEVKDLPTIWNDKMKEYLGIVPPNDQLGVLQDVHWSSGGFGYFPSYTLGNLYAAQIAHYMKKELPNVNELIEKGEFTPIREWLRENIHQHGRLYTPNELIMRVTGEELNPQYLIEYFTEKYTHIYKL